MKIARDPRITKAARVQLLPMAWGTLYELTKLSDAAFKQAISSGAIRPRMTREQAKTVRVKVDHRNVVLRAPYNVVDMEPAKVVKPVRKTDDRDLSSHRVSYATQPEEPDLPPLDVWLVLGQIEQLVGDLAKAAKRGDVPRDTVFAGRIRTVSDRLLTLIAVDENRTIN